MINDVNEFIEALQKIKETKGNLKVVGSYDGSENYPNDVSVTNGFINEKCEWCDKTNGEEVVVIHIST